VWCVGGKLYIWGVCEGSRIFWVYGRKSDIFGGGRKDRYFGGGVQERILGLKESEIFWAVGGKCDILVCVCEECVYVMVG